MSLSFLDKLLEKIESGKGSWLTAFILGITTSLIIWLVGKSRSRLSHRKEYLERRVEALSEIDLTTKTVEEQTEILRTIRMNRNAAKVVNTKIQAVDKKIESTKRRIKSARSIDDLKDI